MTEAIFTADLGGTWLRTAVVSPDDWQVRDKSVGATPEKVTEARLLLDTAWRRAGSPRAVAIAAAPELVPDGTVRRWPNRRAYEGGRLLSDALIASAETALFDDATAAAISGHPFGDRQSTTVCISIGTGVGGGAVIAGHALIGRSGAAMDIGHMPVPAAAGLPCSCGRTGCLQAAASDRALDFAMKRRVDIFREDEPAAAVVRTRAADAHADAIAITDCIFNPTRVLIAGGLGLSPLFEDIQAALDRRGIAVPLARHPAGDDAGLLGAAIGFGLLGGGALKGDMHGSQFRRPHSGLASL